MSSSGSALLDFSPPLLRTSALARAEKDGKEAAQCFAQDCSIEDCSTGAVLVATLIDDNDDGDDHDDDDVTT
jgi:hypothetical protein